MSAQPVTGQPFSDQRPDSSGLGTRRSDDLADLAADAPQGPPSDVVVALAHALDALQGVAADDSLCTLQGERVHAAKYWEGHVVALKALQRARHNGSAPAGHDAAREELIAQWSEQLHSHDRSDQKWKSYLTGGLEALKSVS
ncbi:MAG: hypothetical protein RI518_01165 [Pontimonas sp.]|nr:hypothetical protein [Pontimonas sp.]